MAKNIYILEKMSVLGCLFFLSFYVEITLLDRNVNLLCLHSPCSLFLSVFTVLFLHILYLLRLVVLGTGHPIGPE